MHRPFPRQDNHGTAILVVSPRANDGGAAEAARLLLGETVVLQAGDGALGLEIAIQNMPDLVLVDPRLPDMEGERLRTLLGADPRTRHIPAVMLGGRGG